MPAQPRCWRALDTLAELPAGRRIAVLGHMAELGAFEEEGHRQVAQRAAEVADHLIVKGDDAGRLMGSVAAAQMPPDRLFLSHTNEEIIEYLRPRLGAGDVVLLKGSMEARLEGVVKGLLAEDRSKPPASSCARIGPGSRFA